MREMLTYIGCMDVGTSVLYPDGVPPKAPDSDDYDDSFSNYDSSDDDFNYDDTKDLVNSCYYSDFDY